MLLSSFCVTWPYLWCWDSTNLHPILTILVTLISVLCLLRWFKNSSNEATFSSPLPPVPLGLPLLGSPSLVKEIVCDQDTVFTNRDPPISVDSVFASWSAVEEGLQDIGA
ncbi:hypothetical protein JHK82_054924 [Glycine max]|nr:hypothetical protein JHK85_055728 [Glycine max]KAG5073565.1 hypothetical protein JHK84_054796 [Glycine max]KAG5076229.1 hypothetical protein JHK82_054924 [Glycine max]